MSLGFTARRLSLPAGYEHHVGVVPAEVHRQFADAQRLGQGLIDAARAEAEALQQRAEEEARVLLDTTRQQLEQAVDERLRQIDAAWGRTRHRLEPLVLALAAGAFEQVCSATPARERVAAAVALALKELPPRAVDIELRHAEADRERLPEGDFVAVRDETLAPGEVRVEAAGGAWHASFDAAAGVIRQTLLDWLQERLLQLDRAAEPSAPMPHS
ncbi:hypothetical protein OOT46_03890 [Aquabacterium sp. A7-Y]|uniref:hypothetical protein n=1 Tax=Aquabacterium sp. A7-Y TaxID=1349605 RepID=UPI00223D7F07|nr:hypothetical protein [Aquabacterium sp. A7-Y]MCW7536995.1 hypothetical protein [Aquabacterium sp. A7-Y]